VGNAEILPLGKKALLLGVVGRESLMFLAAAVWMGESSLDSNSTDSYLSLLIFHRLS
jgi:hypothetical protein